MDGIVFGQNPRDGYFKDTRFVHPELAFELTFPAGWSTVNQRTVVAAVAPGQDAVMTVQLAEGASDPSAALQAFLGQEGMSAGPAREETRGGVRLARATFEATSTDGSVRGEAAFIRQGELVYRVLGYADPTRWTAVQTPVGQAISSFQILTDAAILDVQPWTLDIRTLPGAMSLRSYSAGQASPLPLEDLARLNRVGPAEVLSAGAKIKWVVGRPLP